MASSLTDKIHELGQSLLEDCRNGQDISEAFQAAVASLLAPPFAIGFVGVKSPNGDVLIERGLLIYTCTTEESDDDPQYVTSGAVAGAFYLTEMLDERTLSDGYSLIGKIKELTARRTASDDGWHHIPVGMIVACECDRALEHIVDSAAAVNAQIPSTRWPDSISVLSRGVISHAVQFEGGKISGDFILPNVTGSAQFAMYVHVMVSSLGNYTFNRTCDLLFMHLGCFSEKTNLPTSQMVMEGVSRIAVNIHAYMFNWADLLVPVPEHMRQDRGYGLSLLPYRIESREGKLLSRVQFVPWLDGAAAIRIYGDLPLMPFILFLGRLNVRVHEMKTPDGSISSILPIQREQFELMLTRMRNQSNMVVKLEEPSWTIKRMADEGTSSPLMARLFLNVLHLVKCALPTKDEIDAFEKPYELVLMSSITARDLYREIAETIADHRSKIRCGIGVRISGRTVHVDEPIDRELRRQTESFLNASNRLMITGMKQAAKALHLDLSFFFKKQSTFENGIAALALTDPGLADYCRKARIWSEMLNTLRNEMEHNFWSLPPVQYNIDQGRAVMVEPEILKRPVSDLVSSLLDRMLCFVEEVCAHGLKQRMPEGISITEIPLAKRPAERPERFQICTSGGGMPLWRLSYHESKFEEA